MVKHVLSLSVSLRWLGTIGKNMGDGGQFSVQQLPSSVGWKVVVEDFMSNWFSQITTAGENADT